MKKIVTTSCLAQAQGVQPDKTVQPTGPPPGRPSVAPLALLLLLAGGARAQSVRLEPAVVYQLPGLPRPASVTAADINGDGKLDLLTANRGDNTIGALLGKGDGTFGPGRSYDPGPGYSPASLVVADVNGDGTPDLLTANGTAVGVLLGKGGGTFGAAAQYASGKSNFLGTRDLAVGDVNGDGRPDVVTANLHDNSVGVLLNAGAGTFAAPATFSTGKSSGYNQNTEPYRVAVADVNGDGQPDIVATDARFYSVSVLMGNGNGTFQAAAVYSVGPSSYPYGLQVVDVDGDGRPDILTANYGSDKASVLLNNGNGTFKPAAQYPSGPVNSSATDLRVADVNGDRKLDMVVANGGSNSAGVLLGNGDGTFQPVQLFAASHYASGSTIDPNSVAVGDFNGDRKPDLALADDGFNVVSVLLNSTPSGALAAGGPVAGATLTLAPNPVAEAATLHLSGLPAQTRRVDLALLNAVGQRVGRAALPVSQGAATGTISTAGLAAGVYVLHLTPRDAQGQRVGALPTQRLSVR